MLWSTSQSLFVHQVFLPDCVIFFVIGINVISIIYWMVLLAGKLTAFMSMLTEIM